MTTAAPAKETLGFQAEVKQLLDTAIVDPLYPLWMVLLTMGLRSGEARGLQWCDINLRDRLLTVQRQLQWVDGVLTLIPPKSASAYRTLPIPHVTLEVLANHHEDEVGKGRGKPDDLCFYNSEGRPVSQTYVQKRFKALLTRAGLPDIRLHDLRHSCATLLIGKNVPMKTVQEWLGHSDYRITADIYSHVTSTMLDDAAAAMNGVIG